MRRLLACLVVAVAAAWATAPAHAAERGWRAPIELTGDSQGSPHGAQWHARVTTTSLGETVATWTESDNGRRLVVTSAAGERGTTSLIPGAGYANLAADGLGNAYLIHTNASSMAATFRVRPPGGDFGPAETLETNGAAPTLIASPQGDVAAVWNGWGGTFAAVRPRDGTFGPTRYVGMLSAWSAAYSEGGDLVLAGPSGSKIATSVLSPDGTLTQKSLTPGVGSGTAPAVAIDDAGRAVVVWAEQRNPEYVGVDGVGMSQRPAGGGFGPTVALRRAGGPGPMPRVVMSGSGRYTILYPGTRGIRAVGGQAGEAPSLLRAWSFSGVEHSNLLTGSPSGEHVLMTRDSPSPMGSMRTGADPFALGEDVLTTCEGTTWMSSSVGDGGEAASLIEVGKRLLLATYGSGQPQHRCQVYSTYDPLSSYGYDPYRPTVTDYDAGQGTGSWEPGQEQPQPPAPPAPPFPAGQPKLLAAKTGQLVRKARIVVVCGKGCTIKARARLVFDGGEELGSARARHVAARNAVAVPFRFELTADAAEKLDGVLAKSPAVGRFLRLAVAITATGADGVKRTREVSAPLFAGSAARR